MDASFWAFVDGVECGVEGCNQWLRDHEHGSVILYQ